MPFDWREVPPNPRIPETRAGLWSGFSKPLPRHPKAGVGNDADNEKPSDLPSSHKCLLRFERSEGERNVGHLVQMLLSVSSVEGRDRIM